MSRPAQLKEAIQCTTRDGKTGSYLFDPEVGQQEAFSPVFACLVELYTWCRLNGWKHQPDGTAWGRYVHVDYRPEATLL
jgi:hypothetical protein